MKKYIFILFTFLFLAGSVSAQEEASSSDVLANKKGIPILPKKGDYALGISANPFLDYVGNMFNNTADNNFDLYDYTIYGKYYLKDNEAIRAYYTWTNTHQTANRYIRDDAARLADPLSKSQVTDTRLYKNDNLGLGASYQKYRGYGRLQGFYGVYVNYSQKRTQYEYTYGNAITEANPNPSDYWGEGDVEDGRARTLYDDTGIDRSFGLGLLGGVELFFMPKTSIGLEVDFGYSYSWGTQENAKYELWDGAQVLEYDRTYSPGSRTSSFYTYLPSTYGGLFLMFHF
jgi:hypothetical protein